MAEPARRLNGQEQSDQVYDSSGMAQSTPKPDLKVLEGGSQSTEPKRGHLRDASQEEPAQADSSIGGSSPTSGGERSFYKKGGGVGRTGFWRGPKSGKGWRRKRVIISLSVFLAGIAAAVAIFLSLLPLKILHIVNNLQDKFYATSQTAVQDETDNLLKRYITQHVLPSYRSCGTTISRQCRVNVAGKNPVTNLYRAWANDRLENKLATNYGIEFQKRPDGWYLKTPTTSDNGINIGKEGEKIDSGFQKAGTSDIRQAVQDETRWHQVYFRFKVGRLLEEKYGIRRCLIFCSVTDPLAQNVADQKIAAKLFLTQRVLVPRNQTLGIVIECLLRNCAADQTEPTSATPGENGAENGAPENPETDTAIRDGLTKLAASYGLTDSATIDSLVETYTEMSEKGFQNYLVTKALTPVIGESAAGGLADKIPVAGWIDLFTRLVEAANDSSHNLKKLSYITNATAAVSLFAMYRTYADEIKTGHVNATEVGSLTSSLGPGDTGSPNDPEVGGKVGAEGAPLYPSLIDGSNSNAGSGSSVSLGGALTEKVLAASTSTTATNSDSYTCNDGNPVPESQSVCNEEILGIGNHYADLVHEFLNLPGINLFTNIAHLWRETVGQLFNLANDIFGPIFSAALKGVDLTCKIPFAGTLSPYCQAKDLANKYAPQVMQAITQWLIPNPFSSNMSGGRTFDMMAAGADVAGNDSAHTTLGGQRLSDQQTASIVNEQYNNELQQYKHQSFFARLTDTNSSYSPLSRLAMALPMNWSSGLHSAASVFSNPFSSLGHAFSSIFSPNLAFAASAQSDPFGVTQYGYPAGTIPSDPETYWNQNCSDNAAYAYRKTNDWNISASQTLDQNEMPLNTAVNPCLLIMATSGSDGGLFDSSLLTSDDLSDSQSSGSQPNTGPVASGDSRQLAQQILNNHRIDLSGRLVLQDIQDAAAGKPGTAGVLTSAAILQLIATVGQSHSVQISAIQSGGTGHCDNTPKSACPNDPHYTGDAVDFSALDGKALSGRDPGSVTIIKIAFSVLPSGSGFGQLKDPTTGALCGPLINLPSGFTQFADTCNHLHVQVPAGTP